MSELKITVLDNGPFQVEGDLTVSDQEGRAFPPHEGRAIYLCRCGGSSNKPFCDGTHNRNGFTDPEPAAGD